MKNLFIALGVLTAVGVARAADPGNVCEFSYKHQVTVHNGSVPSYFCYAFLTRESCPSGYRCGAVPAMLPQQCSFPAEIHKRRCIPVNASFLDSED